MKPYALAALLILTTLSSAKKRINSNSGWTTDKAFPEQTDAFDKKSEISLGTTNDDKNIYLIFQTTDPKLQKAILNQGFTLYFDTLKQKDKACFLHYSMQRPMPNSGAQVMPAGENAGRPVQWQQTGNSFLLSPFRKKTVKEDFTNVVCNGIDYDLRLRKTVFSASFELDTANVMICKAVIPLRIINSSELAGIHNLSVGLEIKGSFSPGSGAYNHGRSSGNGMGMSSGNGGKQGMGGRQGMRGGMNSMSQGGTGRGIRETPASSSEKLAKIWLRVNLAKQPLSEVYDHKLSLNINGVQ
ncbi:hypothetical protein [Saccharicrinis sp. FJH54]|uniref:hypothetical protein n=1 Tax=Saccharicrinis sp. FJH54 TaxID=3344665 RepID=UPI0035D51BE2